MPVAGQLVTAVRDRDSHDGRAASRPSVLPPAPGTNNSCHPSPRPARPGQSRRVPPAQRHGRADVRRGADQARLDDELDARGAICGATSAP